MSSCHIEPALRLLDLLIHLVDIDFWVSTMATSKQAVKTGPSRQLSDAEITSLYNEQKSELQMLAQKIGELETEADEHA